MSSGADSTKVSRVREAVRRLDAIRAVLRRESQRNENNYSTYQSGQAEGLRLAVMELERALSRDRESEIARRL